METQQTTQNQRVKKVIKYLLMDDFGKKQRDLAEQLGYTESGFSQLVNGKTPISRPFLKKLYEITPNLNKQWLECGEGEMFATVQGNGNVVQAGIGNNMQNTDCAEQLKMALNEMAEQRKVNCAIIQKKDEQIDRLLSIIEKTK